MSELVKTDGKMQPIVILPKGAMSQMDKKRLRDIGICVVEAKDPSAVRFMEPAPQGYSVQEWAAIELARMLLSGEGKIQGYSRSQEIGAMYANILLRGDPLTRLERADKL